MTVDEGRAVGMWLGVIGRGVVRAVMMVDKEEGGEGNKGDERKGEGDEEGEVGDWNVVQNNGSCFFLVIFFGGGVGVGVFLFDINPL